ncbi:hemagglutinin [Stigmatella sp. ncwal1]|uniref:Hemagglutinin n=1 Tax=Stigmatella ashevillensis TaxID=2995309 RepID=A0ABT5DCH7_9BACT|nr:hemagglutinin [Stigmatella ashevillena]MDC0711385.1 hemagglutinin [Stigmatella ashevillena]
MRTSLVLAVLLLAGSALAEPDTFELGTGRNGPLTVSAQNQIINRYTPLRTSVTSGATSLPVGNSALFTAGDLVFLHQSTGLMPVPSSGDARLLHLASGTVGRFEFARVASVSSGVLALTAPLLHGYPAGASQVVSVPEYTSLTVQGTGSLRAAAWNGSTGGILVALVSGRFVNEGLLSVEGLGFRGGSFVNHADLAGCVNLDEPMASGGSYKGEGLVEGRHNSSSGYGNLANGGGGGNCHNAGGGGGAHAGTGGLGGRASAARGNQAVGGLGGAAVVYTPTERLIFGGGGGAGEGNENKGSAGAAGGGLMFLRAQEIAGEGLFNANGAQPLMTQGEDGAGGGGAGGAIVLRAVNGLVCDVVEARGGNGGDVRDTTVALGPGGGGGGGVVFLQGSSVPCLSSVSGGIAGRSTASQDSHGATPANGGTGTAPGLVQNVLKPFRAPTQPTLTSPAQGATGVDPRPLVELEAEPGVRVHLFLDGVLFASVDAGPSGVFSFQISTPLAPGMHELSAAAEALGVWGARSSAHRFEVVGSEDGGVPVPDAGEEAPEFPLLVVPGQGEVVGPMPLLAGTAPAGTSVRLQVDGVEVAQVEVDGEGRFHHELSAEQALAPGAHSATVRLLAAGDESPLPEPTHFEVVTRLGVGCGCGASSGLGWGALVLLWAGGASRRLRARRG